MTHNPSSQPPHEKESFKDKFKASLDQIQANEKLGNLVGFATANTRDTLSYIALIIGIVLIFFQPFYGGALIGLVVGLYFSAEILSVVKNFSSLVDNQGIVRSLIGGGFLLALFICAPAIFIGIALAVAIRQILFPTNL
jgi:hypothetical protein